MKRHPSCWTALGLLGLWELIARLWGQPLFPPAGVVLATLAREWRGELAAHTLASLGRVLAGIALATAPALPLGILMGQHARWRQVGAPLLYWLYPIPKVALAPVLLLLLGTGDLPKILLIALIVFFQMVVLVRDSAAAVRRELLLSVRSLGAGPGALFRWVYLPACLPAVLSAVRQSIGTSLAVLYVAELVATRRGLGYYIYLTGSTLFDYPAMYAGIVTMSLLGWCLFRLVDLLERRVAGWARA